MPSYRIYYLKQPQRGHFRQAAPAAGPLKLKMKDYESGGEIEAPSPYAAWKQARAQQSQGGERRPLEVGDALETDTGLLLVCKYVGFEQAQWFLPEASESAATTPDPEPIH